MDNGKRTGKQLISGLSDSRPLDGGPDHFAEAEMATAPSLNHAETGSGQTSGGSRIGLEKILQDRIDELLEENIGLRSENDRLKQGIDWLQQNRKRFGEPSSLLHQPPADGSIEAGSGSDEIIEKRLQQAQKMETVGALAGGIAHDFNNILTAIIASASLMQRGIEPNSPLRRHIDRIFSVSERATALTQSILAYSRRQPSAPSPIKLDIIIENLRKLISRIVPENIKFTVSLSGRDLLIMADTGQIEHVVMNLVGNAIDAMPFGGELSVKTGKTGSDFSADIPTYMSPGDYVVLSVTDTGSGMDSSTRERLFEPFFTTKEVGKGTGLGLAMAYGIIKQHNGYIEVRSEPGCGTSFNLYFPLIENNDKGCVISCSPPISTGRETILLIEDDPDVRNLLKEMLESYEYRVIEAVDGDDGVEKFMIDQDRIRLILSDVMMPGKSGKEAFNDIRKIRGDIRVIFISGYSDTATNEILGEGMDFLAKPVSPLELMTKIREALDR